MFEAEISRLAFVVRESVAKRREAGLITTQRRVWARRRDHSLKYRDDFGFAYFKPERSEVDTWDWNDHENYHKSVLRELDEFTSLAAKLTSNGHMLEDFVRSLSFASFHGLDDQEVRERASALARQLDGQPLSVKVTAYLDAISIEESPLQISNYITLRKPTEEDVAERIEVDEYGGSGLPLGETWFQVVGEFVFQAFNTGPAQISFLRTVEALRLFHTCGVASNRYRLESRHHHAGGILSGSGRFSRFTYTLSRSDAITLSTFLEEIVPLLPDPISNLDQATDDIGIAHARYIDSLFQSGGPERTVTSAITALEALFLKNEPELTHRLAQRVSVFLRALGTRSDAYSTYVDVVKGYKIRSTFIHGGSLKTKERPMAESLVLVLVEYARQCVLARYQMTATKDELLGKLDRAMIDPSAASDLNALLVSVVHR